MNSLEQGFHKTLTSSDERIKSPHIQTDATLKRAAAAQQPAYDLAIFEE
jgi:hypothetical protein